MVNLLWNIFALSHCYFNATDIKTFAAGVLVIAFVS